MSESNDRGIVLALGSLAVAAFVFVFAEMSVAIDERAILKGQIAGMGQRLKDVKVILQKVEEAMGKRDQQLKKADETEAVYAALLTDLIELANVDPTARAIVQKWKIQHDPAAAASSSGADVKVKATENKLK
jgi:Tfp pilus assembly protein PilN